MYNNFEFKVIKIDTNKNHILIVGNTNSIEIKPFRLEHNENLNPNEITKKLTKYNDIISEYKISYFIGISIDFVSGFNHEDLKQRFLGKSVEFVGFGKSQSTKFNNLGKIRTELGDFYHNPQLSGIITLYKNKYHFLINPIQQQIIHHNKNITIKRKLSSLN